MFLFPGKDNKKKDFEQMFRAFYPKLVRYATQLVGDRETACDMVEDVMEQAWRGFDGIDVENRSAWLYTSVRHACLNRLKHLQVEAANVEALREATRYDIETDYKEHEALLVRAEEVVKNLPEPTCTILRLCYYERLTYKQVAERLDISPDTVKKHISKALRTLREALSSKGGAL